jgi:hypothetical protein
MASKQGMDVLFSMPPRGVRDGAGLSVLLHPMTVSVTEIRFDLFAYRFNYKIPDVLTEEPLETFYISGTQNTSNDDKPTSLQDVFEPLRLNFRQWYLYTRHFTIAQQRWPKLAFGGKKTSYWRRGEGGILVLFISLFLPIFFFLIIDV